MNPDTQELFLLEFLVNHVNIPSVQAMQDDILQVKTCIEFRILNLPPIFICQNSFSDNCACLGPEAQVFRKGKSCLFALPCRLLQRPICSFPVMMSVYKKLPPTILPDVMTIGCCNIELRDMINALLDECVEECPAPCKTLKNNFRITTLTGQCVGEVGTFIRFSRFGKKIVTQFQMPHNKKPYLFKGCDESPVFQCRKVPSVQEDLKKYTQPPGDCCGQPKPEENSFMTLLDLPPIPNTGCCGREDKKRKKKSKGGCGGKRKSTKPNCGNGMPFGLPEKETPRACGCDK